MEEDDFKKKKKICGLALVCLDRFPFGLGFLWVSTISDPSRFRTVGRDFYCCMHTINNSRRIMRSGGCFIISRAAQFYGNSQIQRETSKKRF